VLHGITRDRFFTRAGKIIIYGGHIIMSNIGMGELIVIFFILLITVSPVVLTYMMAKRKNRSKAGWLIGAILFGWLAFIAVLIVPAITSEKA